MKTYRDGILDAANALQLRAKAIASLGELARLMGLETEYRRLEHEASALQREAKTLVAAVATVSTVAPRGEA